MKSTGQYLYTEKSSKPTDERPHPLHPRRLPLLLTLPQAPLIPRSGSLLQCCWRGPPKNSRFGDFSSAGPSPPRRRAPAVPQTPSRHGLRGSHAHGTEAAESPAFSHGIGDASPSAPRASLARQSLTHAPILSKYVSEADWEVSRLILFFFFLDTSPIPYRWRIGVSPYRIRIAIPVRQLREVSG
jgi:hypothetical protein